MEGTILQTFLARVKRSDKRIALKSHYWGLLFAFFRNTKKLSCFTVKWIGDNEDLITTIYSCNFWQFS